MNADERCAFCGARATERDHLTGCPVGARTYLDPDVWVPCDRTCNLVNEHAWSAAGLLVAPGPLLVVRMKRFAFGTARLHDASWTGPVHPGFWGGVHRLATDVVVALERLA